MNGLNQTLPVNYNKLTPGQRRAVRQEYQMRQGGACHYCKQALDGDPAYHVRAKPIRESLFPKGFLNNPVHLHHNHQTGMTIGAVHAYCNAVLWQYHGE